MYPIPPTEKLVETKNCRHCQSPFPITDKDLEFYEKVSPVFPRPVSDETGLKGESKKYLIPTPTLCPDCRQQRRLSFRNERKLYKRKCDATGRDIISIYAPCEMKWSLEVPLGCSLDKPFKVYHQDFWWSDKWDAMEYGRDFDFSRPFFEQFGELMKETPHAGLLQRNGENSEYTSDSEWNKNCYLCSTSWENQDCMYAANIFWSKDCIDGFWVQQSEKCYECVSVTSCIGLKFSSFCNHCSLSSHIEQCQNLTRSLCCFGIKNGQYFYLNKQYWKEEFEEIEKNFLSDTTFQEETLEKYEKLKKLLPRKYLQQIESEWVIGEYISWAKDCVFVFDTGLWSQNVRYSYQANNLSDAVDITITWANGHFSKIYEWVSIPATSNAISNITVWESNNMLYNSHCYSSSNLFWCIGLRNKSYCILNKQYTKDEYEALVPKIIEHMTKTGEWGEFFPSNLSPFGYNETVAQEYYPLDRDCRDVSQKHLYNWSDYEAPFPKVEKIIPASKLPDDITKIPDDILNWAIMPDDEVGNDGGRSVQKPFRIIKQELEFYRKHNLPIPRRHPDQRHLDRMALRNPRKLFERKCDKCQKDMITTYAPERPEMVYCEECYNREVIG